MPPIGYDRINHGLFRHVMPLTDTSDANRVRSLSDKQRETLRLTYMHKSSKEIALVQEVTSFAIDAQIARAMKTLGVTSRREAAQLVMRHAPGTYERLVYQSPPLADPPNNHAVAASSDELVTQVEDGVAEVHAAYVPPSPKVPDGSRYWKWGNPDDVRPITRAWLIPTLAFIMLAIAFTSLAMGERASRWAYDILPSYGTTNT